MGEVELRHYTRLMLYVLASGPFSLSFRASADILHRTRNRKPLGSPTVPLLRCVRAQWAIWVAKR